MPSKRKSLLKTNLGELTERQLKLVALMSPQPTVSIIRDNEISAKFVYLLCQNDNCVTGVINEDVPPKFYYDGSKIRCRYCRRPLDITNPKVTPAEIGQYCSSLPRTIEPTRK
jgi:aspartate carbamoyltransferase regulatory subunit